MPRASTSFLAVATTCLLASCGQAGLRAPAHATSPGERPDRVEAVRLESAVVVARDAARPLPLVGGWSHRTGRDGFDLAFQLAELRRGVPMLPWLPLLPLDWTQPFPEDAGLVRELARAGLPLALVGPEWEFALPDDPRYFVRLPGDSGPATAARGPPFPRLSPTSPLEGWYEAGSRLARHPALERLQRLHPNPPRVLFVSNNEYPKLRWHEQERYHGEAGRRELGDAWIERYRLMIKGFRAGLREPAWRDAARFIGYDAFAGGFFGRWSAWLEYSLLVPGRIEPWPLAFDGASVSYYLYDWNPITDFTVWSPQVEAMNLVPALQEAYAANPDFWLELSVWDGQQRGLPSNKAARLRELGQAWSAERYEGLLQFGLWLLRPRSVREFRNPADDRGAFGPYFAVVQAVVARVHAEPTLREFWSHGRLVENGRAGHPYQERLPAAYERDARWFLLETAANPPRPWSLETRLGLFSIALELGAAPRRRWLVYAHSPLHPTLDSRVEVTEGVALDVRATRSGSFWTFEEGAAAAVAVLP